MRNIGMEDEINGFKIIQQIDSRHYIVRCKVCSNQVRMRRDGIKKNNSCGCLWRRPGVPRRLQHSYAQMKERCYGHSNARNMRIYKDIGICDEWIKDSKYFYKWALENGYSNELTLDRIDNLKDYSPENCRWATKSQQQRNRNCSRFSENDVRYIRKNPDNLKQADLARKFNVNPGAICRIQKGDRFQDIV